MRRAMIVVALFATLLSGSAGAQRRRAVAHPRITAPRAEADQYSVGRGKTLTVDAVSGVLANDRDPEGKPLAAILVSVPLHGVLTLNADGSFTYTNDSSPDASDSFTYKASNGTSDSTPAVVMISITESAPLATADIYTGTQGVPIVRTAPGVLANDILNGARIASYGGNSGAEQSNIGSSTFTAQSGSVAVNADGGFTYNPQVGFAGTDAFKYVLSNPAGSSSATVTLTITPAPPVATNDSYSTKRDTALSVAGPGVLANDIVNGAVLVSFGPSTGREYALTQSARPTAQGGTVLLRTDGSFAYTPASNFTGNDSFRYVIANTTASATATVAIAVNAPSGPDFTVTSPGFFFVFSGVSGNNPVLTLKRGRTYTFQISTSSIHPFEILGAPAGSVTNNNISNGTLTFAVPSVNQAYRYLCSIHGFGNVIETVP